MLERDAHNPLNNCTLQPLSSCVAQVEGRKPEPRHRTSPRQGDQDLVTDTGSFPGTFSIPVPG